jgi:D-3-phosphoglycerate dehydrogenase
MGRRFKVVITDCPFPNKEPVYETLAANNAEVILCESVDKQTLKQKCKDADAIIVAYADIDEELINSMDKCKIIARLGIGMNNVNVEAQLHGEFMLQT